LKIEKEEGKLDSTCVPLKRKYHYWKRRGKNWTPLVYH